MPLPTPSPQARELLAQKPVVGTNFKNSVSNFLSCGEGWGEAGA